MAAEFSPDPTVPGYLYIALADYLADLIADQTLPPGARLPGERDLAAEHGISIGTVRRATGELRERGLVVTLPAKGTYVARVTTPTDRHDQDNCVRPGQERS
jgi:GntR family transcriptional regulator